MEQYLLSRFEPIAPTRADQSPIGRRARIKQIGRRIVPPFAVPAARFLLRNRYHGKRMLRHLLSPFLYDRLKRFRYRLLSAHAQSFAPVRADRGAISYDTQVEMTLSAALSRAQAPNEASLRTLFLRDLDRLLCLADAGPNDHVYLPTAHGREAYAIRQLIQEIGEERSPTFHLEFRHPVATLDELESGQDPGTLAFTLVHRAFFDACRAHPDTPKMRYYTDTDLLAVDYAHLAGFEFQVLPIPFRAELIPPTSSNKNRQRPLKIVFLGDVREEKGFLLLPDLVRALFNEYVKTGRVRFVVQAGIHPDSASVPLQEALEELEEYGAEHVELFGRDGFVDPKDYYVTLANSDIVLCPYLADVYKTRSSGIMAEALIAGKPTVVQEGSWLARQLEPGAGESFTDAASLVDAVRSICDRYPEYAARARVVQGNWRENHSPARLVDGLLGTMPAARSDAA